jgi:hypothetical protein
MRINPFPRSTLRPHAQQSDDLIRQEISQLLSAASHSRGGRILSRLGERCPMGFIKSAQISVAQPQRGDGLQLPLVQAGNDLVLHGLYLLLGCS